MVKLNVKLRCQKVNPAVPFPDHLKVTDVTGGHNSDFCCVLLKTWTAVQLN